MSEELSLEMPPADEDGMAMPLPPLAMAYVMELHAAGDRINMHRSGRADFVRSFLRGVGQCRFANRRGISSMISRPALQYGMAKASFRREVDRLRPMVHQHLKRKLGGMFDG